MTINCPRCFGNTLVINTRGDGYIVFRERECNRCHYRFTTFETIGKDEETVSRLTKLSRRKEVE